MPGSPSNGDRYLVGTKPSDTIVGIPWDSYSPGFIAEWSSVSSTWIITSPTNGMSIRVDNDDNSIYRYEGGTWEKNKESQVRYLDATTSNGASYSSTSSPNFDSYDRESIFIVKFNGINTFGTASLNINGLGNVEIKRPKGNSLSTLDAYDITTNYQYTLTYDGTYFLLHICLCKIACCGSMPSWGGAPLSTCSRPGSSRRAPTRGPRGSPQ
jgi:hypothetical protein